MNRLQTLLSIASCAATPWGGPGGGGGGGDGGGGGTGGGGGGRPQLPWSQLDVGVTSTVPMFRAWEHHPLPQEPGAAPVAGPVHFYFAT
jgi:hypothetical protein